MPISLLMGLVEVTQTLAKTRVIYSLTNLTYFYLSRQKYEWHLSGKPLLMPQSCQRNPTASFCVSASTAETLTLSLSRVIWFKTFSVRKKIVLTHFSQICFYISCFDVIPAYSSWFQIDVYPVWPTHYCLNPVKICRFFIPNLHLVTLIMGVILIVHWDNVDVRNIGLCSISTWWLVFKYNKLPECNIHLNNT